MPKYIESWPVKMEERKPRFRPSLDFINEDADINRVIVRESRDSPLSGVRQNEVDLSSVVNGVELDELQRELLTHNKMLEAKISLSIMDHPGKIGDVLDRYSGKLSQVFSVLRDSQEIRDQPVTFNNQQMSLGDVFDRTTFRPLHPSSDQIGRMSGGNPSENDVKNWLIKSLKPDPKNSEDKRWKLFLTKVKGLSSFGTTVWQLFTKQTPKARADNRQAILNLISKAGLGGTGSVTTMEQVLDNRFQEFRDKTRSILFDDPISRARSERMPLGNDGNPIRGKYSDASDLGMGFGQVVQEAESSKVTFWLWDVLDEGGINQQINAIPRQGAPIEDLNRPFMLSRNEFDAIPKKYPKSTLKAAIEDHYFNHGVGINRWQPYGIYGMDANRNGYPSAGAQSGGTTDVMLGLAMLNLNESSSIYGEWNREASRHENKKKDDVLCMTTAVAAFMNYGGYHTFSEVLPIGQSIAENTKFVPTDVSRSFKYGNLYKDIMELYKTYGDKGEYKNLEKFEARHRMPTLPLRYKNRNNISPDIYQPVYTEHYGSWNDRG
ncbi:MULTISPECIES: hypothetical protein [unclassified Photorhabdus]|uniref:hypothetical protein n=1 Tax=unclassified Photorhabdus TaxID=2620880 RepID=UPI000DCDC720|nr:MULTISPECIES: hypothetical protein [unclassified Photorhabdus]RAW96809.1 hypothetical protein CKY05_14605 [Photorhabdus sp. S10-54]RAW97287.1 hypothetical protein CKY03_13320 [Photorhabdus sp. S9-53]RAX01352.1 hypothetical protein CKY04_14255 [Photorhabdus sp. S8-52]